VIRILSFRYFHIENAIVLPLLCTFFLPSKIATFFGRTTSIAIVMDTTGSMDNDLDSVKNTVLSEIVNNYYVTVRNPLYILVEVNDPFVSPAYYYTDALSFSSKLNTLTAYGGDDCEGT
jgi:hypothetical protein